MADARGDGDDDGGSSDDGGDSDDDDDDDDDEEDEDEEYGGAASPMETEAAGRGSRSPAAGAASPAGMNAFERAEQAKKAGNDEYKRAHYGAAVRYYSEAIRLQPTNATYLINRAAASLMSHDAEDALADCMKAIELEPSLVKAHVRAAKSLTQLGKISDARRQLESAAASFAGDETLANELQSLAELDGMIRGAKDALAQEGGAAAREALRLATAVAEHCACSEVRERRPCAGYPRRAPPTCRPPPPPPRPPSAHALHPLAPSPSALRFPASAGDRLPADGGHPSRAAAAGGGAGGLRVCALAAQVVGQP